MGARDVDLGMLRRESWNAFLRPPPLLTCAQWADLHRNIAKGPEKGRWRTDRTPYLREPMECTDPEHPCQKVVMQFATQLGKSEVLYNALLKRIHLQPVDMMMVQPTLNDAKDHSRQRFTPTVKTMPPIFEKLPPPRSREEQNTWQTKEIRGGATLFFAGANSARSLASKPLGFVVCDEIDGYPLDCDGEGDPLALVGERMSNYGTRKLLLSSTPTVHGFSRVEAEYLASDRRRYWLPCPYCGEFQVLAWGASTEHGIKWLKTDGGAARPETAVYVCRHCGAAIEERHKTQMLHDGEWRADAPGAQRGLVAGFHLSKLYSPLGWKSWAMLVEDWEKARESSRGGDQSRLKTFVNTSLAETWEEDGDKADQHALLRRAREAKVPLGTVTHGLYVATQGVDVQGDRLEAYTWAWGRGMERQLVERRVIYGDPALLEHEEGSPWAGLTAYRRAAIAHVSGKAVPLLACFVDSGGHHTNAVYAYAREHRGSSVYAIKGASKTGKDLLAGATNVEIDYRGQKLKRGIRLWLISTDIAKAEIYGRLRTERPGPGFVHLSADLPPEVFEQLTAERLVTRYVKGHPKLEWIKPAGRRNEALDCAVYALAAAHFLQMDRWRESDWSQWQARVEPAPEKAQEQPAAPPKRRLRGSIRPGPR